MIAAAMKKMAEYLISVLKGSLRPAITHDLSVNPIKTKPTKPATMTKFRVVSILRPRDHISGT